MLAIAIVAACDVGRVGQVQQPPAEPSFPVGVWEEPGLREGLTGLQHVIADGMWIRTDAQSSFAGTVSMQILQFDAPSRRIIGFWTENPFHPRRFAVVELTRTQQPAWMYCDLRVDLLDQETANAVEAADSKSLFYGCAGGPWRMLQPSAATAPMGEAR